MFRVRLALQCESKGARRRFFDLKAFRKGISEKKQSLVEAEKREVDRVYAKSAPGGWTVSTFIEKAGVFKSSSDTKQDVETLAKCFENWNDFISSSRKDILRVSHFLTNEQVKRLAHTIELFNRGLFPPVEVAEVFAGDEPVNANKPWNDQQDRELLRLAIDKYDYTFGDVWPYVAWELERGADEVRERFTEIFLKRKFLENNRNVEIVLSKSFRPLLMNRQFRLLPPQCYIVPSAVNFGSSVDKANALEIPAVFRKYIDS